MKILLAMPRFKTPGYNYDFPLGIAYVSAALKKAGHQVVCLNLNNKEGHVEDIVAEAVRDFDPDACGSGGLTPHFEAIDAVFNAARREKGDILNIVGGGVFSSAPETIARLLDIDIGVIGEGENTIVELAEAFDRGDGFETVSGVLLVERDGSAIRTPDRRVFRDIDALPWPDLEGFGIENLFQAQLPVDNLLFNVEDEPRCVPMIASRSCPFSCTFCYHPNGRVYRERSLDDFFAELDDRIARYQINLVTILDELFAVKKERLVDFCARMKDRPVRWMAQLHVTVVDAEVLDLMKESGCVAIGYGLESMNAETLLSMKKKATPEQNDAAMRMTRERGIGVIGNLIFGDPADTMDSVNETLEWWARNRHYQVSLVGLKVLPGAEVWHQAVDDNRFSDEADSIRNPNINLTRFRDADVTRLVSSFPVFQETALVPGHIEAIAEDGMHPVRGPLARFDWTCPGCGHENQHRRIPLRDTLTFAKVRIACRSCLGVFDLPNPERYEHSDPADEAACTEAADLFQRGRESGDQKKLSQAIARYRDVLSSRSLLSILVSSSLRQAVIEFAEICESHLKDRGEAMVWMGRALFLDPWNVPIRARFARILMEQGLDGAALLHFRIAQKLSENDVSVPDTVLATLLDRGGEPGRPVFAALRDG